MKTIKKLLLVLMMAMMLCGCGEETLPESPELSLVIIAGRHANAMLPTQEMLESSGLQDLIGATVHYSTDSDGFCYADLDVKVIVCDGNPEVVTPLYLNGEQLELSVEDVEFDLMEGSVEKLCHNVMMSVLDESMTADDPEVDLVAAITTASNLLAQTEPGRRVIMILDPGLSTTGVLDMDSSFDIQRTTADELMEDLAEGGFPDLEGTSVFWYGLGNIDRENQTDFTTDSVVTQQLIDFWTAYLTSCKATIPGGLHITVNEGGTAMVHAPLPDGVTPSAGWYPNVSNVAFVLTESKQEPLPPDTPPEEEDLFFSETKIAFKPGKAEFVNERTAITELSNHKAYYAQCLAYNPETIFYVVGSVARDDPNVYEESGTLSWERAEAVAKLLVTHCGIPKENIRIIGAGMNRFTWRNAEEYNGTTPNYENCARNRVVAVIPSIFPEKMSELEGKTPPNEKNLIPLARAYTG